MFMVIYSSFFALREGARLRSFGITDFVPFRVYCIIPVLLCHAPFQVSIVNVLSRRLNQYIQYWVHASDILSSPLDLNPAYTAHLET